MKHWKKNVKIKLCITLTIIVFSLNLIPMDFLLTINNPLLEDSSVQSLRGRSSYIVQRLMKSNSQSFCDKIPNEEVLLTESISRSVGTQTGEGIGNILISDSLIRVTSSYLTTSNSLSNGNPGSHQDSFSPSSLINFTQNNLEFRIQDVIAQEDWRSIENEVTGANPHLSTAYIEVAQKFVIAEEYANITTLEAYLQYYDLYAGDGYIPHGNISIFTDDGGKPGVQLGTTTLEEGFDSLDIGHIIPEAWVTYNFVNAISVTQGSYWIVLNDTGNQAKGYWKWYAQQDSTNEDAGDWAAKSSHGGLWELNPFPGSSDILSAIRILPTDAEGNNLTYQNPETISFNYSTLVGEYELNQFSFIANNTEIHNFFTNVSITFTLMSYGNFSYNFNPLLPLITYRVENGSMALWNASFSSITVPSSETIANRTFSITGIPNDWNGSQIYWNESSFPEYSDLTNNPNITWDANPLHSYTYGNSTMVINASQLREYVTWNICFDVTNYISDFQLLKGGTPLTTPLIAYNMDILDLIFLVGESGGNASYWIEYEESEQAIVSKRDVSYSGTTVLDSWSINSTLDQNTNINGTYNLQTFWINADKNKVGTYTRRLEIYVNTSFDVQADSTVIIGDIFNVTAFYKSIHNNSDIKNAQIWCEANWTSAENIFMNQVIVDNSYNTSFQTTGQLPGDWGSISITTQVRFFVNWTQVIYVKFIDNTSLYVNSTNIVLEWYENTSLRIDYLNSTGDPVRGANVTVNGHTVQYNEIIETYLYHLNSSDFTGVGTFSNIPITASHVNHLSRQINLSLTINLGFTGIKSTYMDDVYNNQTEIIVPFSDTTSDRVSINFQYYHILTLRNLSTSVPIIESLIPVDSSTEEIDNSWTIVLNPNQTGTFSINVTFNLVNYYAARFIIVLNVQNALTSLQTDFVNYTQVYYDESFEIAFSYLNLDWSENITFNGQAPILISDDAKIRYLNRTGDLYWFEFAYNSNEVSLGVYSITITFTLENFKTASITVIFDVIKSRFVNLIGIDTLSGETLDNGTSNFIRYYSSTNYDNLSISFRYYEEKGGVSLNLTLAEILINKDSSIFLTPFQLGNLNWTIIFDGTELGMFLIQVTFSHENYTSLTIEFYYSIEPGNTFIGALSPNIMNTPNNAKLQSGLSLEFWVVWQNEYGEYINDSNGVQSNDSSVIFLNSVMINGTHYFQFTAGDIGVITINLTFETLEYTALNLTLRFEITERKLFVDDALSTHEDYGVSFLQYGDLYFFQVYIKDDNELPIDITNFVGNLPINVTFWNVSNGLHTFSYHAWIIGSTNLLIIRFDQLNYQYVDYHIRFSVEEAESEINSNFSSISTYWTQDTYFSVVWQSVPNPLIPSSSSILINGSTPNISHDWIVFQNDSNGNYTFLILADLIGSYSITVNFELFGFKSQNFVLQIDIIPVPTYLGIETTPNNTSIIGEDHTFHFSEIYAVQINWKDILNNSGIVDVNPIIEGNGSLYFFFIENFSNGTHVFNFDALELGFFTVKIHFSTTYFEETIYSISFIVTIMPTQPLNIENFTYNASILVENTVHIIGEEYRTEEEELIPIDSIRLWMNGSEVSSSNYIIDIDQYPFYVDFSTSGFHWGSYNLTLMILSYGYEPQEISLSLNLIGRKLAVSIEIPQGSNIEWGEEIDFIVTLNYSNESQNGGWGAAFKLASLEGITVEFDIILAYRNGTLESYKGTAITDATYKAIFTIGGQATYYATSIQEVRVNVASSTSSLALMYIMPSEDLPRIQAPFNLLETLLPLIIGLVIIILAVTGVYQIRKMRKSYSMKVKKYEWDVEQSFEEIKSIQLILFRHASGLKLYSEKTLIETHTDTDALSGVSTAISTFIEDISEGMGTRRSENGTPAERFETISKEGFYMLIWNGEYSSIIIISETPLPDYFKDRLGAIGFEFELAFDENLKDVYSTEQFPESVIKKMIRRHIPLHYFSAFAINEGVLLLNGIKLSNNEKKMFSYIKRLYSDNKGMQILFSEQIISHLAKKYKRSQAIKFFDRVIELGLLVEYNQESL